MSLKILPNLLSCLRLLLVIPFVYFFYHQHFQAATIIFVIAAFTDALDGYLARVLKCQTQFGLIIDPLADKILIVSCFLLFGTFGLLPWALILLILSRDLAIILGAIISITYFHQISTLKPSLLSKLNTVLQLTLIITMLVHITYYNFPSLWISLLICSVVITTSTSFIHYFWSWYQSVQLRKKNV